MHMYIHMHVCTYTHTYIYTRKYIQILCTLIHVHEWQQAHVTCDSRFQKKVEKKWHCLRWFSSICPSTSSLCKKVRQWGKEGASWLWNCCTIIGTYIFALTQMQFKMHMCIYIYVYVIYTYRYVNMYQYTYQYMHICICVRIYTYACIYVYIQMYIKIYINKYANLSKYVNDYEITKWYMYVTSIYLFRYEKYTCV